MKRLKWTAAILLTIAVSSSIMAQSDKIFPYPYRLVELDNGFKAYFIDTGPSGQIAYVTVVRTGSREEVEPGRSGYAHFFEHMMFRGTDKYPDYSKITVSLGASRNAFTSSDQTVYYLVTANNALEQVMDLESDRFMRLNYSEADFRRQAVPVLGEFNQGRANPFRFLFEQIRLNAFDKHTYRHTTIGFEEDVRAMPEGFEYSREFFKRFYRPENCVLLLAGDFDDAKAEELLRKYYGDWEPGYQEPNIEPEPEQTAPREAVVEFPGRTSPILSVNYKGPAWSADDRTAVAAIILGRLAFGQNSEIFKKLVLDESLVQFISPSFGLQRDPYLLGIYSRLNPGTDIETIKAEVAATVTRFRESLCDEAQLADTKSAMKYEFLGSMENPQGTAFALLPFVVNTGTVEAVDNFYNTLMAVTPEDVQRAAQTYLTEARRTTVTLVPPQGGN